MLRLSVIIPTLNEAEFVAAAVASARDASVRDEAPEIIVSDCGSTDGTADIAREFGVHVVEDGALDSRAAAINRGAKAATGDVLLALDADSLLPEGYDADVEAALADPRVVGGAFEMLLDAPGFGPRLLELVNRIRYRIRPRYYGDQGIFTRAAVFREVGGYPPIKVMEAARFCDRVRRVGRLALIRKPIRTSARRFDEFGFWRLFAHDIRIWFRDVTGGSTEPFGDAYVEYNRLRGRARTPPGS